MPTVVAPETDDAMTRLFAEAQEASPPPPLLIEG